MKNEEYMKKTRNILMALFWGGTVVAVLLAVVFETGLLPKALWQDDASQEVVTRMMMELVTLAMIPLSLYLFKIGHVHADLLKRKEKALNLWGVLRLLMLLLPMVVNTLLYYMFMQTTYGYMAIILLISLPFVFPSMGRCKADTEE